MTQVASEFTIEVEQLDQFEFVVRFDKESFAPVRADEPPPLGHDVAPNAARYLAVAVGNCLSASLLFCSQRAGHPLAHVKATVHVQLVRNEQRRLRIGQIEVSIQAPGADGATLAKCLPTFEDFCVVTQSVRQGVLVRVSVNGQALPETAQTTKRAP
ncbi:MAG TPA: OsmC family protein [Polyangiaceae bacterium]|nr:OsmC family protein [Polyangiaceae bacterium]